MDGLLLISLYKKLTFESKDVKIIHLNSAGFTSLNENDIIDSTVQDVSTFPNVLIAYTGYV